MSRLQRGVAASSVRPRRLQGWALQGTGVVQNESESIVTGGHRPRFTTRGLGRLGVIAALALSFAIPSAGAQDGRVEIPVGTVVRTAPGVTTVLGIAPVPDALVGTSCGVSTRAENNRSVHPGNDLIVESGGDRVRLSDVEGGAGKVTTADSALTLGTEVRITLIMGPDGVFSGGASAFVVVDCTPPTTSSTSTSTTTTSSTVPATTTPTVAPSTTINGPTTTIEGPTTTIDGPSSTTTPTVLPSTTINGPTTTVPSEPPTLALTGPRETLVFVILGLVLLDLGYLIFSARRPGPAHVDDD